MREAIFGKAAEHRDDIAVAVVVHVIRLAVTQDLVVGLDFHVHPRLSVFWPSRPGELIMHTGIRSATSFFISRRTVGCQWLPPVATRDARRHHNYMTTPAQAITKLLAAGMTQQTIAARIGTNQSTISRILSGHRQPFYATAKKLIDLADGVRGPYKKRMPKP